MDFFAISIHRGNCIYYTSEHTDNYPSQRKGLCPNELGPKPNLKLHCIDINLLNSGASAALPGGITLM